MESLERDYGIDLILATYSLSGELERSQIYLQVKATEHLQLLKAGTIAFRVNRSDLIGLLRQFLPVILIVCDAVTDRAYWQHFQGYFSANPGFDPLKIGNTLTVYLNANQVLLPTSVREFAVLRDQAEKQGRSPQN